MFHTENKGMQNNWELVYVEGMVVVGVAHLGLGTKEVCLKKRLSDNSDSQWVFVSKYVGVHVCTGCVCVCAKLSL